MQRSNTHESRDSYTSRTSWVTWTIRALLLTNFIDLALTYAKIHTIKLNDGVTLEVSSDRVINIPCIVHNNTYLHGETFLLDCKTQCVCENGRYGCSPLCPQENISPRCKHPRLVDLPGHCCKQWICDPPPSLEVTEPPKPCVQTVTKWSECSAKCGMGLSHRESNVNAMCETITETRICQERICERDVREDSDAFNVGRYVFNHHIRRGHECKATHRPHKPIKFRFGPCVSQKHFRPKFCGECRHLSRGLTCQPQLTTTIRVDFTCQLNTRDYLTDKNQLDIVIENVQLGENLWIAVNGSSPGSGRSQNRSKRELVRIYGIDEQVRAENKRNLSVNVQWILKCACAKQVVDGSSSESSSLETVLSDSFGGEKFTTQSPGSEVLLHRVHRTAAP